MATKILFLKLNYFTSNIKKFSFVHEKIVEKYECWLLIFRSHFVICPTYVKYQN